MKNNFLNSNDPENVTKSDLLHESSVSLDRGIAENFLLPLK